MGHSCEGQFCEIADNILGDCDEIKFKGKIKRSGGGGIMLFSHFHGKKAGGGGVSGSPYAWYKADDLSLNDNDSVSSWADASGNGHTLVNVAPATQPTYKTGIQNSLPAVLFDGTEFLAVDYGETIAQPNTMFMVLQMVSTTANRSIWDSHSVNNRNAAYEPNTPQEYGLIGDSAFTSGYDIVTGVTNVLVMSYNGVNSFIRIDSGNQQIGDGSPDGSDGFVFGAAYTRLNNANVYLMEAIIYNGAEDVTANEAYLTAKWNI